MCLTSPGSSDGTGGHLRRADVAVLLAPSGILSPEVAGRCGLIPISCIRIGRVAVRRDLLGGQGHSHFAADLAEIAQ